MSGVKRYAHCSAGMLCDNEIHDEFAATEYVEAGDFDAQYRRAETLTGRISNLTVANRALEAEVEQQQRQLIDAQEENARLENLLDAEDGGKYGRGTS